MYSDLKTNRRLLPAPAPKRSVPLDYLPSLIESAQEKGEIERAGALAGELTHGLRSQYGLNPEAFSAHILEDIQNPEEDLSFLRDFFGKG